MKIPSSAWRYGILVFGLALLAVLVMDFNNRTAELSRLTTEQEQVSERLNSKLQTQAALESEIEYATSEAAVEDWAYRDGRMVRPDDNPVVPVQQSQVTPTPTPVMVKTQKTLTTWEAWLALFFGPRTP